MPLNWLVCYQHDEYNRISRPAKTISSLSRSLFRKWNFQNALALELAYEIDTHILTAFQFYEAAARSVRVERKRENEKLLPFCILVLHRLFDFDEVFFSASQQKIK